VENLKKAVTWVLAISLATGCAYIPTTSLEYAPVPLPGEVRTNYTVAVLPLIEKRPPKHYPGMQGRLFMTYIPLLPYVKIPYERLDESFLLHQKNLGSNPDEDQHFTVAMARATARDLDESGIFREVRFASSEDGAGDADLLLVGSLDSTEFDVFSTSYGLGIAGVL